MGSDSRLDVDGKRRCCKRGFSGRRAKTELCLHSRPCQQDGCTFLFITSEPAYLAVDVIHPHKACDLEGLALVHGFKLPCAAKQAVERRHIRHSAWVHAL